LVKTKEESYLKQIGSHDVFRCKVSKSLVSGSFINLFGMDFYYDVMGNWFLMDRYSDYVELLCILEALFRYLNSINKRGFVNDKALDGLFVKHMASFMTDFKFETKVFGNSGVPDTMWFNLFY
jgi:hypothetical protein